MCLLLEALDQIASSLGVWHIHLLIKSVSPVEQAFDIAAPCWIARRLNLGSLRMLFLCRRLVWRSWPDQVSCRATLDYEHAVIAVSLRAGTPQLR